MHSHDSPSVAIDDPRRSVNCVLSVFDGAQSSRNTRRDDGAWQSFVVIDPHETAEVMWLLGVQVARESSSAS